jgi:hypothetical protein
LNIPPSGWQDDRQVATMENASSENLKYLGRYVKSFVVKGVQRLTQALREPEPTHREWIAYKWRNHDVDPHQ